MYISIGLFIVSSNQPHSWIWATEHIFENSRNHMNISDFKYKEQINYGRKGKICTDYQSFKHFDNSKRVQWDVLKVNV